ncbi:MAG: ADP-ribosylglycohydrolase family protein [Candidatus Electrothrix sp. YB6]
MTADEIQYRICGAVLASAAADTFGAPYEGGFMERALWVILGRRQGKRRWTDDTAMSLDVIVSLLACGQVNQDDLARRFARSYTWSRGYGRGAAKLLLRIRRGESWQSANRAVFPDGSYGNGGAMRAAPVGLFYSAGDEEKLVRAAKAAAAVTHAHPLGQEGAALIALTAALSCRNLPHQEIIARLREHLQSPEFQEKIDTAAAWLQADRPVSPQRAAAELGNGIRSLDSCVTAVYIGLTLRNSPFSQLLRYIRNVGGDTDTIGAMAGAIWGAACGRQQLPDEYLHRLEQYERLEKLAENFAEDIIRRPIVNCELSG